VCHCVLVQSYFTQKMQAALQWYFPEDHTFVVKGAANREEIELRSGTHQVPVLITPENWCIADSTPLLTLLDARLPESRFYPAGGVGLLSALLEEYFDEWSARWCIGTRWMAGEENAIAVVASMQQQKGLPPNVTSQQIKELMDATPAEAMEAGLQTFAWGKRAARAIGVETEIQVQASEDELLRIFTSFEDHLASGHKFVFGDAPTAVDCVMMGGLRAHFLHDPHPQGLLRGLDRVAEWCHTLMNTTIEPGAAVSSAPIRADGLSDFVKLILKEMGEGPFKRFVQGNGAALAKGEKAFVIDAYGEDVSYLCRPYVEKSRRMLVEKLRILGSRCAADEAAEFAKVLGASKLGDIYGPAASL
jgi:glutathione S-transferase